MIAKHHSRKHFTREKRRLCPLLSQTLFRVLFGERNFIFRKRRFERDFRQQSENTIVKLREGGRPNDCVIGGRTGRETRTHARNLVRDLFTGFCLSAFRQKTCKQICQPGKIRWIESSADTKRKPVADQWQSFIFNDDERQTVRQGCLSWRRDRDRSRL